jgi:hypothetical protein
MSFVIAGNSASTGYNLTRSLRFRASASAYLNRTPVSTTNQKTYTYSLWFKRGALGTSQSLLNAYYGGSSRYSMALINSSDVLEVFSGIYSTGGSTTTSYYYVTTQVFRDPSAWYHLVVAVDTSQATAANRVKIYVNGSQVTAFSASTTPSQNADGYFNVTTTQNNIGQQGSTQYFDGYLAEVNFVDGSQLTPSSFGSTNAITGVWQPARYTGTYGTNGFYLPFTDNSALTTSSNVGLGKDFSGNGNYWTTNNISITAGVTYDSMTDVPTLTSATAANFAVLNPLAIGAATTASGNLNLTNSATVLWDAVLGTMGFSSGKYYWEMTTDATYPANVFCGVAGVDIPYGTTNLQDAFSTLNTYGSLLFCDDGKYQLDGSARVAYSTALTASQVLGVAVDRDAKTCVFYKNGVSLGSISFSSSAMASKTIVPLVISYYSGSVYVFNFGQRPFSYTPPTGFVSLNTFNLP